MAWSRDRQLPSHTRSAPAAENQPPRRLGAQPHPAEGAVPIEGGWPVPAVRTLGAVRVRGEPASLHVMAPPFLGTEKGHSFAFFTSWA